MKPTRILAALLLVSLTACVDRQDAIEKGQNRRDMAYDLLQKGEQGQAISLINQAIGFDPKNAEYHNLLGLILMSKELYEEAEKEFFLALKFKPEYPDVNNNLCGLYIQKSLWDEAINQCKKALTYITYRSPERSYINMGQAYYKKADYLNAIDALNKAILHRKEFYLAYQFRGMVQFDMGKYNLAIDDFKKAAQGCSFCAEPYYRLGLAFFKVDRKDSAQKSFAKCSELDKEGEFGNQCRTFIKKSPRHP